MKINDFPDDENLWLIKWIDRYTLPHLTTRSASVQVLLQKLEQKTIQEIARLNSESIALLLGTKPKSSDDKTQTPDPIFRLCSVHTGSLPLVTKGLIFKQGVMVGVLPCKQEDIEIPASRLTVISKKVSAVTSPPEGWGDGIPHFALCNYEFSGVKSNFPNSLLFIYKTEYTEYIIPSQVIFQTFYAPDTQMARAFTSGPWNETASRAIFFGLTKGGHRTCIDSQTGSWHVILETRVRDIFARHLAILWWDDYAKARAQEIHARALQERGSNMKSSWHCKAQLPFHPDYPLKLRIVGYKLRPFNWTKSSQKSRFIVTRILSSEEPSYIPEIYWQRVNSGQPGLQREISNEQAPYSQADDPSDLEGLVDDAMVSALRDSFAGSNLANLGLDTFEWKNAKPLTKLIKARSDIYAENNRIPSPSIEPYSTGEPNHQTDSLGQLGAHVIVRDPVNRFTHLIEAMTKLKAAEKIDDCIVLPPSISSVLEMRGSVPCWNFLNDDERENGKTSKRGWKVIKESKPKTKPTYTRRTALILEVTLNGKRGYWIEIECKTGEAFKSPFLWTIDSPDTHYFLDILQSIVACKGKHIDTELLTLLQKIGGITSSYKHLYKSPTSAHLNEGSIYRFVQKCLES